MPFRPKYNVSLRLCIPQKVVTERLEFQFLDYIYYKLLYSKLVSTMCIHGTEKTAAKTQYFT